MTPDQARAVLSEEEKVELRRLAIESLDITASHKGQWDRCSALGLKGTAVLSLLNELEEAHEALRILMDLPTCNPLAMTPEQRSSLWKVHAIARKALSTPIPSATLQADTAHHGKLQAAPDAGIGVGQKSLPPVGTAATEEVRTPGTIEVCPHYLDIDCQYHHHYGSQTPSICEGSICPLRPKQVSP